MSFINSRLLKLDEIYLKWQNYQKHGRLFLKVQALMPKFSFSIDFFFVPLNILSMCHLSSLKYHPIHSVYVIWWHCGTKMSSYTRDQTEFSDDFFSFFGCQWRGGREKILHCYVGLLEWLALFKCLNVQIHIAIKFMLWEILLKTKQ